MKIRPLNDRIVVERLEAEDKTAGGIYLPDAAKEKPKTGKVVAVGQGKLLDTGERFPKSRSTAKSTSSCVKMMCWRLLSSESKRWTDGHWPPRR